MRALTVQPGRPDTARMDEVPDPREADGAMLVETIAVGICGTDNDLIQGHHGEAPPGHDRLILGHEALGRVLGAPADSGFSSGDLVAGIVRRPDPQPCANCAVGEWDMCRNGKYTERGIKGRHGYASERFRIEPEFAVRVAPELGSLGVLVEPCSVLAKAWEHVERIGRRAHWTPHRVLITGAGPVGLLAALLAGQRGFEVHVLDRVDTGIKPEMVRSLGGVYHTGNIEEACRQADVLIECTGVAQLVFDAMRYTAPNGIVCLTGISSGGRKLEVDLAAINRDMVLENDVVFGSVNANRRHYEAAAEALAAADPHWLARLITRRVPLDAWHEALEKDPAEDVKTVIEFGA